MFDGHNGAAAAVYAKERLLANVLGCVPAHLTRDEWLAALPRALVAGFVKTDKDFQTRGQIPCSHLYMELIKTSIPSTTNYCHV